ncbi:CBS domain-containing protein [Streptomyces sp. CG 926]|uniref:CBS domain-containing protein n=1 Tax=Streptomyces sp. CG 926 TaxID=1882405 RepID=UPI00215A1A1F|nr:CBS domain-containing protein [Streptomyces sp. CG 926]
MKHLRTVNDVMTHAAVSIDPGASVHDITESMSRWGFSSLPVLSTEGQVVGVVSEADLLTEAEGADASHAVTAGQLMTASPVTVPRDATIAGAARLMTKGHFKHLPVVDADGRRVARIRRRRPLGRP